MKNFVRFCLRTFFYIFKVRCQFQFDLKKLPQKGVYVSNHVSYLDPVLLFAFLPGNPIFALNGHLYRRRFIRFLMKTADIMNYNPIEPADLKELINKVNDNRLVVIFAEGRITETGGLMKIYEAPGLLADKTKAPIIPIWIEGPQYSYFSKTKDKLPHRPMPKMLITVGSPKPLKLKDELRRQRDHLSNEVYHILTEMQFKITYNPDISIFAQLVKTSKVYSKKGFFFKRPMVIEDINRKPMSYKDLLLRVYLLGKFFKKKAGHFEHVGLLLPNTIAAAATFLGLSAYERVPVMLNFSVGAKNMLSMCRTAQVKFVITSLTFIHTAKLEPVIELLKSNGVEIFYLETLAKKLGIISKLGALLRYKTKRVPHKHGGNRKAVILFTSGSEGAPKAVVLSHANIISNIKQVTTFETINMKDLVFNAMPMFHSFGLTIGTLFPLLEGGRVFLDPSPLHYRVIAELIYELGATILFGTDTFFRGYGRIAHPYDFYNVRFMYAGAEAVKLDTRNLFMEHMGVRIMEAYGVTECAPFVAANNHVYNRFGSIGKIVPGVQYKIEPVPGIEKGGELVVKGPNIMLGYILPENPGVLVPLEGGWYHTGDVVEIDEIGYVFIKDRIKRFAKIGGEMVSLNAVQDMVIKAYEWMGPDFNYGIVAVPHESKGEQIVLVTNNTQVKQEVLHDYIKNNGMSELFLPRTILYHDKIPTFLTGKTDNVTLKKEVMEELGLNK
ncbi:MAG: AMP-binding protein [Alphaproteobacteria bacterium]|nr:AMP-binding protein [Alphaproteobacteria bacterium]